MALTRDFNESVRERAQRDVHFREALSAEAIAAFRAGEMAVGKAILGALQNKPPARD